MEDANYYFERGKFFYEEKQQDYDKAIADYDMAIKLKPNDAKYYVTRGMVYATHKHDFDKAFVDFARVIMLDSHDSNFFYFESDTAYDSTLVDLTLSTKLKPGDARFYFYRGIFYAACKKDYDRAVADFTQAITINQLFPAPADARFYFYRGLMYKTIGKKDLAQNDFEKALELEPNYEDALEELREVVNPAFGGKL
jgi:tetratricopeptide (TPR) repeat protein